MKPRFFFWTVSLVTALAVSSCASATTPSAPTAPTEAANAPVAEPADPSAPEATASAPAEVPVQAVATSRGDSLEATDPTTFNLASGQLQLVEFFRFT